MIPVFFPFTYLNEATANALMACFNSIAVYQPSGLMVPENLSKWIGSGFVGLAVPFGDDNEKIAQKLSEFNNWADIHHGGQLDLAKLKEGKIPFFEESSISQIRAEIKKSDIKKEADPLFKARLFLQIAQEFDLQQDELNTQLAELDSAERELYRHLKGESKSGDGKAVQHPSGFGGFAADYMPWERLKAWACFFCGATTGKGDDTTGFFVTCSPQVFDRLIEKAPAVQMVLRLENVPVGSGDLKETERWQKDFDDYLNGLADGNIEGLRDKSMIAPKSADCTRKVSLSVMIAKGLNPREFFSKIVDPKDHFAENSTGGTQIRNTLIGLVEDIN